MVCNKRAITREAKKREPGNDVGNAGLGADLGHMSCVMCSCYQEGQSLRSTCKCYLSVRVIQDNSSRSPLLN